MATRPRTYTPEQRAALVAGYCDWVGTQRSYAEAVGVPQGTMSKWLAGASQGSVPAGRRCACAGCRAPMEGRRADARFCSDLCRAEDRKAREREARGGGVGGVPIPPAPTMLEVVPVTLPVILPAAPVSAAAPGVRLLLPGGAELHVDALPPARWVAELAAELRRC